jgi:hypothetical protein
MERRLMLIAAASLALVSGVPPRAQPRLIKRQSIDSTVVSFEQVFVGRIVEIGTRRQMQAPLKVTLIFMGHRQLIPLRGEPLEEQC